MWFYSPCGARTHPMHFSSEWVDPLDRFARLPFHPLLARDHPHVMFSEGEGFFTTRYSEGTTFTLRSDRIQGLPATLVSGHLAGSSNKHF